MPRQRPRPVQEADYLENPDWQEFLRAAKESQAGKEPGRFMAQRSDEERQDEAHAYLDDDPENAAEILEAYADAFSRAELDELLAEHDIEGEPAERIRAKAKA